MFETYVLQNKYAIDINHGILYNFFLRDLWVFSISIFIVSVFLFLRKNNLLHIQKIRICIICLIIFDLWFFGKDFITTKKPESIFPTPPIIQKIKKDTGTYRVFDLSQRLYHVVTRNALESTIGVNSMQLKDYHDFFWLVGDHENWEYESFFQFKHKISNPQILNLLNVKYIISDEKLNNHEFQKIYTSSDQLSAIALPALQKHPGFFLYKNTTVLPRAL